jgi:hypothetical protein
MPWYDIIWTPDAIEHLAVHGVTPEEFEEVVFASRRSALDYSRSTGLPLIEGFTDAGRWLVCVFEFEGDLTIIPVTAYEPDDE